MRVTVVRHGELLHTLTLDELGELARIRPGERVIIPSGAMYVVHAVREASDGLEVDVRNLNPNQNHQPREERR